MSLPPTNDAAASAMSSTWHVVDALERFEAGRLTTFKKDGHQLVLGRRDDGDVFALDNRCPHEGYPLAQGDLRDCSLTCAWHNWKFDVRDGTCTLGGEDVRAYPVRVRGGRVEVDLADPGLETVLPGLRASLHRALFENDTSWALRAAARLLRAGAEPRDLLVDVARYDARHAEYGTTHTLAVAADCARLLQHFPGVEGLYPIAVALDLCAESNVHLPERAAPETLRGASLVTLRAAVDAEDAQRVQALLRGAFQGGTTVREVQGWLFEILSDRFLDFGHPLIYAVKAAELLDGVEDTFAADVYAALLDGIVHATREERLPYLRGYFRALPDDAQLARWKASSRAEARFDFVAARDSVLDGSARDAVGAVRNALESGVSGPRVARALVAAAARRFLRFDARWEDDDDVAENWLWATHRLTFASAVRNTLQRCDAPQALRFLFQAAAFVHSGRRMDAAVHEPPNAHADDAASPREPSFLVERVVEAVEARRADRAVGAARAALSAGAASALRAALEARCVRDPAVQPIFVAHILKTTIVAFDEYEALAGEPDQDVPVLATVRFLASPLRERRVAAAARNALRWVVDGVMPRKLTQ